MGGSVRDLLIEGKLSDLDYTTNATPNQVQKIFPRTVPVGIKFGTILVLHNGQKVEITTYRADADYQDGRRPEKVEFAKDLATDIRRRDFTINGLAYSVTRRELADHCNGIQDLEQKILRTIGDPVQRFTEDGLRPIRGCRIAAKLGLKIEEETRQAMLKCVEITAKVSHERFFDEWRKTLRLKDKRAFWENLLDAGIIKAFLPHLTHAFESEKHHAFLEKINQLQLRDMSSYAASLFHLLGATDGAMVRNTLLETKFPIKDARLCESLLRSTLLSLEQQFTRQQFKAALSLVPRNERTKHIRFFTAMRPGAKSQVIEFYQAIRTAREPLDICDLVITGNDLQALGFMGKKVGEILEILREAVVVEPAMNVRESLLAAAEKFK